MESVAMLADCMEFMATMPDGWFDLAVVDPPYGIARFGNRVELTNRICKNAKINTWDIKPTKKYWDELFRVSKFQIIWGANNFQLPTTEYFIIWDKQQTVDNFASAEYAWSNCKIPARVFRYSIHKEMATRKDNGGKIHPTQKPIKLYQWIYANYLPQGGRVFDSHAGSNSNRIAADMAGNIDYYSTEIDPDYFRDAELRWQNYKAQTKLIFPEPIKPEQTTLIL